MVFGIRWGVVFLSFGLLAAVCGFVACKNKGGKAAGKVFGWQNLVLNVYKEKERGRAFWALFGFLSCDLSAHQDYACDCSDGCDEGKHYGDDDER
jgi:hypothetical protein